MSAIRVKHYSGSKPKGGIEHHALEKIPPASDEPTKLPESPVNQRHTALTADPIALDTNSNLTNDDTDDFQIGDRVDELFRAILRLNGLLRMDDGAVSLSDSRREYLPSSLAMPI